MNDFGEVCSLLFGFKIITEIIKFSFFFNLILPFKLFCDDEREAAAEDIGEVEDDDDDLVSYVARLPTPNVSASSESSYFCCIALLVIVEEDMSFSSSFMSFLLIRIYQIVFRFLLCCKQAKC